jgi:type I restriction enzyme S subunit
VAKGRKLAGKVTREVPYLRVANVQAGGLDLAEMKNISATEAEIKELSVAPGDVLLTEGGDFDKVGRGALLETAIGECIHQNHIFRVRVRRDNLTPEFFAAYLQTFAARQYFLKAAKKTSNLASINMTQLRSLPVPVPTLDEQAEFSDKFRQCRSLETQQSRATEQADRAFQSLLAGVFKQ